MKEDIYNRERMLKRRLEKIESSDMSYQNRKALIEFYRYSVAQGLSISRIEKCLRHLYHIACLLKKPFDECNKEDVVRIIEGIERSNHSDWTKHDYKVILKKFFKWLRDAEDYPEEVKWIKASRVGNRKLPEQILTEDEVKRMAEFAGNARDRALVLVLYESGCRIGELLSLRIKNVEFDSYGAVLHVFGKTGSRRVRIISSSPAILAWLENHPFKGNSEAFLFVVLGTRNHGKILSHASARALLRRLAKKAVIRKRVNPHSFRHARATHLANKLTEAQMKELFGWVQASDMASVYVHLSGRDVDNALLKLHGLAQNEKKEEEVLKLKVCPRCQERNDPISSFCRRCASPLDIKIAMELDEKIKRKDEVVAEVMKAVIEELKLEEMIYKTIKKLKLEGEF